VDLADGFVDLADGFMDLADGFVDLADGFVDLADGFVEDFLKFAGSDGFVDLDLLLMMFGLIAGDVCDNVFFLFFCWGIDNVNAFLYLTAS